MSKIVKNKNISGKKDREGKIQRKTVERVRLKHCTKK